MRTKLGISIYKRLSNVNNFIACCVNKLEINEVLGIKYIIMSKLIFFNLIVAFSFMTACSQNPSSQTQTQLQDMPGKIEKSDKEWKEQLTPEQYRILREKGTERAFTGAYWDNHEEGIYLCAGCGQELFESDTKFESGSGWPSFYRPADSISVKENLDKSHGMLRSEITCNRCGGHLGHVFNDGPKPTGLRYCINSASLKFEKKQD